MDNNFLVIENISKSFGDNKVLENINLNISKSEFFGLLGSSGSGKTTLLRILGGFEKPDTGRVMLDGMDITNLEPFERPLNYMLSLIHISEPTRLLSISYAVFCLKKKK